MFPELIPTHKTIAALKKNFAEKMTAIEVNPQRVDEFVDTSLRLYYLLNDKPFQIKDAEYYDLHYDNDMDSLSLSLTFPSEEDDKNRPNLWINFDEIYTRHSEEVEGRYIKANVTIGVPQEIESEDYYQYPYQEVTVSALFFCSNHLFLPQHLNVDILGQQEELYTLVFDRNGKMIRVDVLDQELAAIIGFDAYELMEISGGDIPIAIGYINSELGDNPDNPTQGILNENNTVNLIRTICHLAQTREYTETSNGNLIPNIIYK